MLESMTEPAEAALCHHGLGHSLLVIGGWVAVGAVVVVATRAALKGIGAL